MHETFDVTVGELRGRTAVLRVRGRLDAQYTPILLDRIAPVRANAQHLVLNLAKVSFMGSSGVGAMLALTEQFQEQGCRVRFASLSPAVESVIKLLNLDRFLAIDANEEESIAAIGV